MKSKFFMLKYFFISILILPTIAESGEALTYKESVELARSACESEKRDGFQKQIKAGGEAGLVLSLKKIAGIEGQIEFSKEEWGGVSPLLKKDLLASEKGFRDCKVEMTKFFASKVTQSIPQKTRKKNYKLDTKPLNFKAWAKKGDMVLTLPVLDSKSKQVQPSLDLKCPTSKNLCSINDEEYSFSIEGNTIVVTNRGEELTRFGGEAIQINPELGWGYVEGWKDIRRFIVAASYHYLKNYYEPQ